MSVLVAAFGGAVAVFVWVVFRRAASAAGELGAVADALPTAVPLRPFHPRDGAREVSLVLPDLDADHQPVGEEARAIEHPRALIDDLKALIDRLVPERDGYRHDDPRVSDCERGNAHSHLRAALLGRNIAVGVNNGELTLGRFQSVIFAELDGPRKREISIQVIGE